jgi:hypothetical protein
MGPCGRQYTGPTAPRGWNPFALVGLLLIGLVLPLLASAGGDLRATPDLVLLAPTVRDLDQDEAALRARLERAAALGRALARVHNHLGERLRTGATLCEEEGAYLGMSASLLDAHRAAAQAARAQARRVAEIRASPTVSPLIDPARSAALAALQAEAEAEAARHLELDAWAKAFLESQPCQPPLEPCPGLANLLPEPDRRPVALYLPEGTGLCRGAATPEVSGPGWVVVEPGSGCAGPSPCSCAPSPLLPGMVFEKTPPGPPAAG